MRTPLGPDPSAGPLAASSRSLVRCINRHDLKNAVPNTVPVRLGLGLGGMTDEIVLLMRLLASFR